MHYLLQNHAKILFVLPTIQIISFIKSKNPRCLAMIVNNFWKVGASWQDLGKIREDSWQDKQDSKLWVASVLFIL